MRLGVLFSGGKDSCFACFKAMREHEVVCLISIISSNPESYMFHVPNIGLTKLQAEAMGLPIVLESTEGRKEEELDDLKKALERAKGKHGIEGVVTGAIASVYQSSRIGKMCKEIGLACINPLWGHDQLELVKEVLAAGFEVIISGIAAYPMGKEFLGKEMCPEVLEELEKLQEKHQISPSGEGGELETFVCDGPIFKRRIEILEADSEYSDYSGVYLIKEAKLVDKSY